MLFFHRFGQRAALAGLAALLAAGALAPAQAQTREDLPGFLFDPAYRSSRIYEKKAVHDGNQIAITVHNYGLLAGIGEVRGNWPKGSDDFYVGDVLPTIAVEVPVDADEDGVIDTLVQHVITVRGPRAGPNTPPGNPNIFWGFEPKPGFAAPVPNEKLALSTDPDTWPAFWPDQPAWIDPATGEAQWNGFFGRGIRNADLESYFWLDDHNDEEVQTAFPSFVPDTTAPERGGLGLAVKVRGLQWAQFLAQDALFMLYEVTNTSTTTYPRVATGLTVGTLAGGDGDSQDDLAFFDQANRFVYSWDFDDSGNQNQGVGYVGYGFMESPGDDFNRIDDDGDGDPLTDLGKDIDGNPIVSPALAGSANTFTQADFAPRTLAEGDPIVTIDQRTGRRTIQYLGSGPLTVVSQGIAYTVAPGDEIQETEETLQGQIDQITITERNLIDEDLDGVVDEDVNLHFERRAQNLQGDIVTLPSLRYVNYVGFAEAVRGRQPTRADSVAFGFLNPMIDEARDDGIDNDGDWDPISDDVGRDGVAGTGDLGEGDGVPSPGEPGYDALDVDESDQVGLTSFFYFTPPGALRMNNDQRLWDALAPGFFTTNEELQAQQAGGGVDGDFIFGSGYFRLEPGQTLRFSMALVFGEDLEDITNNTQTVQEIYNRNYQFARPPDRPQLFAVPGDGRVTLYWDSEAEASIDPILGQDFEGYKLYKSTDPFFRDPQQVTDAFGNPALLQPEVQYDLDNGVDGFWLPTAENNLYERVRGTPFYLGGDTGLRHSFVDTLVENGRTYYYALTAYDAGSPEFYPAENNFAVSVAEDGTVVTGANVVEVRPNAPVAGYEAGRVSDEIVQQAGPATGEVFVEVLNPSLLPENARYTVTFDGDGLQAETFTVARDGDVLVNAEPLDAAESVVFDGQRLRFRNEALRLDPDSTGWTPGSNDEVVGISTTVASVLTWNYRGTIVPYDYVVDFSDELDGQMSIGGFRLGSGLRAPVPPARQTNLTVRNATLDRPAEFVIYEPRAEDANGRLDAPGELIFIYETLGGERTPTFALRLDSRIDIATGREVLEGEVPGAGDAFVVHTAKPFTPADVFVYGTAASRVDEETARARLDRIRVVPNPYVGAASWERPLPPTITSGRGERRIDFINVPPEATIRIYTVRGELVRELRHDGMIEDGTVSWDLRTREQLEVAYGVYFYHVRAPGIGETTGKLALIK